MIGSFFIFFFAPAAAGLRDGVSCGGFEAEVGAGVWGVGVGVVEVAVESEIDRSENLRRLDSGLAREQGLLFREVFFFGAMILWDHVGIRDRELVRICCWAAAAANWVSSGRLSRCHLPNYSLFYPGGASCERGRGRGRGWGAARGKGSARGGAAEWGGREGIDGVKIRSIVCGVGLSVIGAVFASGFVCGVSVICTCTC